MSQTGYLLIADITGYTTFLTHSELDHAKGILDGLFKSILDEIKPPIMLSNLQGDAALAHIPNEKVRQRQFPLDAIERIYCSFANTLGAMRLSNTCTCKACANMSELDLKFFLHHGDYALQEIAGRTELQGPEVIRVHRLTKNSVVPKTGIRAYALVTESAVQAIGLPEFFDDAIAHVEAHENLGETGCRVYDLAPVFERWRAARRIVVSKDEPLVFEAMDCYLPVPPAVAWAYMNDVELKRRWQQGIDGMTMTGLARGRVALGTTQHCAHGKDAVLHDVVDWRPFEYVTWHIRTPMGTVCRQTAEFTPLPGDGTRLALRTARPEGASRFARAFVRMTMPLIRGKLVRDQRASRFALEKLVLHDLDLAQQQRRRKRAGKMREATMPDVRITYCKPCGYLKRAEEASAELKKQLGIDTTLSAGKGGIFEVRVNGKVVAKKGLFRFPDTPEIVKAVTGAVKSDA